MADPTTKPAPDRSPRPARLRFAVGIGATLLTLAVCEVAVRTVLGTRFADGARSLRPNEAFGRHDPDLGWTLRPDVSTTLLAPGTSYRVTTNARGFRGAEVAEARTPGRARIVVLGDSFSFGWGVNDGETFADLLAAVPRADPAASGPEVANLGVPGYSTDQELWMFEREGMRLRPDVVLLQFCFNDPENNESALGHGYLKPYWVRDAKGAWDVRGRPVATYVPVGAAGATWSESLATRSALWAVVTGTVPLEAPSDARAEAAAAAAVHGAADRMGPDSATVMVLRRLKSRCDEIGAKLAVFDASAPGRLERPHGALDRGTLRSAISQRLAAIGRATGFATLSVDRAMLDAADRGETVTIPDGHWSAAGHRIVAAALAEQIAPLLPR